MYTAQASSIGLLAQALCFSTNGRHAPVLDLCGAWVLLSVNVVDIDGFNFSTSGSIQVVTKDAKLSLHENCYII